MYIHTYIVCLSVCSEDGQLSERECISRVSCRYGGSEQVSQYICASILSGKSSVPITSFNRDPFSEWTSSLLSLAVTATSIIFVATNTRLSRPIYVWSFVGTNTCCHDRQAYFCRDKRGVLSPQTHICRDKTSLCSHKSMLFATKPLSWQNCVWYFVATKIRLSFVATKIILVAALVNYTLLPYCLVVVRGPSFCRVAVFLSVALIQLADEDARCRHKRSEVV